MEAVIVVWLLLSVVVGVLARRKGRSWFGWTLLALVLTPLIGLPVVLLVKPGKPKLAVTMRVVGGRPAAVDDRRFYVNVVGESHYQENLALICGKRTEDGVHVITEALLVPEADNPYDPNAVRVEIKGLQVGHLAREAAVAYRQLGLDGKRSYPALITGGWDRGDGDEGGYGVKLDLPRK